MDSFEHISYRRIRTDVDHEYTHYRHRTLRWLHEHAVSSYEHPTTLHDAVHSLVLMIGWSKTGYRVVFPDHNDAVITTLCWTTQALYRIEQCRRVNDVPRCIGVTMQNRVNPSGVVQTKIPDMHTWSLMCTDIQSHACSAWSAEDAIESLHMLLALTGHPHADVDGKTNESHNWRTLQRLGIQQSIEHVGNDATYAQSVVEWKHQMQYLDIDSVSTGLPVLLSALRPSYMDGLELNTNDKGEDPC